MTASVKWDEWTKLTREQGGDFLWRCEKGKMEEKWSKRKNKEKAGK